MLYPRDLVVVSGRRPGSFVFGGEMTEPTKAELYTEAQALEIEGRSTMDKDELAAAIEEAKAEPEVKIAVEEFEQELADLDSSNDPDPEPGPEPEPEAAPTQQAAPPAPAISQEPMIQGGLGYLTDRAQ